MLNRLEADPASWGRMYGGGDQRDGDHDQRLAQGADDLDLIELRPGKVRVQHARRETRQPEQPEAHACTAIWARHISSSLGTSGIRNSCGTPIHMITSPICKGVVVLDLRQVQRQQVDRAIQPNPHPDHWKCSISQKLRLPQDAEVDQRIGFGRLHDHKADQADQGDAAQGHDQARFQPVLAMAFLQEHLQAAQADAEGDDAG